MKKILITGGSGFIGSHFVNYILKNTDWNIVLLERLNFSGNLNRISELESYQKEPRRVKVVCHDLLWTINDHVATALGDPNYIVHFAASTHVDRAIKNPVPFYQDNVIGTSNLIEYAKKQDRLELMVNFNTDEVYGPAAPGVYHKEGDAFNPSNDYSAAKVGQWAVGRAAFVTHKFPVISTHTMNNFGERQHAEKFLPKTVKYVLEGKPMPIYATVDTVSGEVKDVGSRVWMYAENTAD
ncbi:MAG: NAD-dependent epimerase/dehydratase family protein, partial [Nitrospiria bacterium]